MSQIRRILHVKDPLYISPIDYVQSSNIIPIIFKLFDYELTSDMTASVLVIRPDKTFEFDPATIDLTENAIVVQPTSTMFAIYGGHYLQVRLYNEAEEIQIAFEVLVRVARDRGALASVGTNVIPFIDRAVIYNNQAEQYAEAAAASAEAAADSESNAENSATAASLSESRASTSAATATSAATTATTMVQRIEDNADIIEILRNADQLIDRIEELHALELEATLTLLSSEWALPTITLSRTITGATTSSKIKAISLVSGDLSDYLKVVSADITATNTITFTANAVPAADIVVKVTYI